MEVVASLSQGRTAAAQCGLFTRKSVPVIFELPIIIIIIIIIIYWTGLAQLVIHCWETSVGFPPGQDFSVHLCPDRPKGPVSSSSPSVKWAVWALYPRVMGYSKKLAAHLHIVKVKVKVNFTL